MNHVALIGSEISEHECWEDAVQQVVTATASPRGSLWYFHGLREGALVFNAPLGDSRPPVAWIASPQQFQAAKSRGDLAEPIDAATLIFRRAGGLILQPGFAQRPTTMNKTQEEPTVYCIVADHFIWHGKNHVQGATLEIVPRGKAEESKLALHLKKGWLRKATPEDRQQALKLLTESPAPVQQPAAAAVLPGQVQMVPLADIRPDPTQPRKTFDAEAMAELVDSIKSHGVEQAILVRPRNPEGGPVGQGDGWKFGWYEIVYGERRWRASKEAGLTEIPAKVRDLSDIEAAEKQGIENLERADLLPLEVAAQYRKLLDLPGYGMERLVAVTGHKKNTIYGKLKLLDLPEEGIKAVVAGKLQASVGELIGRQDEALRAEVTKRILKPDAHHSLNHGSKAVTVKEAERIIDNLKDERKQAQLRKQAASEAEGRGLVILNEEESRSISHYSGGISPSCGFVGATDKCPRDPNGRTWRQVMKGQPGVKEYASIRWEYNRKTFSTTALYKRDEVNPVLKKLGLWSAEGSAKSKELEKQRAHKEKAARDFERMQQQLDALSERAAATHLSTVLRVALLALVRSCSESCYHAAKRRALISAEDKTYATMGQAQKKLRELVQGANVKVLSELVGDLAAIILATDNVYFTDGIKTVAGLLGLGGNPAVKESADVRTGAEEEELEDAA